MRDTPSAIQVIANLARSHFDESRPLVGLALTALQAAICAADPMQTLPAQLKSLRLEREQHVFAIGKAGTRMARAVEVSLPPEQLAGGMALVPFGHAEPLERISVHEGRHPLPDQGGMDGCRQLAQLLAAVPETHEVLLLVSGGGSALLAEPAAGLGLPELIKVYELLLQSGWPIERLNRIRCQLLEHAGGRLAARSRARVRCLVLSDVPGDRLEWVSSGPACLLHEDPAEALEWLARFGEHVPSKVVSLLRQRERLPRPLPNLSHVEVHCLGSADRSLEAAASVLTEAGYEVINLGSAVCDTSIAFAKRTATLLESWAADRPDQPRAWLSGGELGHALGGTGPPGRGGRNTAFLAALLRELAGNIEHEVLALAADTDGIDGTGGHAGAWFEGADIQRASCAIASATHALEQDDSAGLFERLNRLIVCGPTHTNVNDIRIILAQPSDH